MTAWLLNRDGTISALSLRRRLLNRDGTISAPSLRGPALAADGGLDAHAESDQVGHGLLEPGEVFISGHRLVSDHLVELLGDGVRDGRVVLGEFGAHHDSSTGDDPAVTGLTIRVEVACCRGCDSGPGGKANDGAPVTEEVTV